LARWWAPALVALALGASGCGSGGVAKDATVTVYVSAPLCAGARQELARNGDREGDVRVQALCLGDTGGGNRLAAIGANARRATEDSTTVGYIESPDPTAIRFSRPILDEADIALVASSSGTAAMTRLLQAIRDAGSSGDLRNSVHDELEQAR